MAVVTASSKYQIAIPKSIRTKLNIKPGQKLTMNEEDGVIKLIPLPGDPVEFLCGYLADGTSATADLLAERKRDLEHE